MWGGGRLSGKIHAKHTGAKLGEQVDDSLSEVACAADDPDVASGKMKRSLVHGLPICVTVKPPSMVMISPVM
jgi:hypothetical protein